MIVVRTGYATKGDFKTLRVTFPSVQNFRPLDNHVDVGRGGPLRKLLASRSNLKNVEHQKLPQGLCDVVKLVLGRGLPKASQLTDWERRPLLPEQVWTNQRHTLFVAHFLHTTQSVFALNLGYVRH